MKSILRIAFCLAALLPARFAFADDDSNGIKVDVIDDMTVDGHSFVHPDKAHPTYYYPIVKGNVDGGAIITGDAPPPPANDVLRMVAKALFDQGYVFASKAHPPSIILMFWWGTKAPRTMSNGGFVHLNGSAGASDPGGQTSVMQALQNGTVNTNTLLNPDEMKEIVLGSKYQSGDGDTEMYHMSTKMEELRSEWTVARYYMMISAMDFKKAMTKDANGHPNLDVLWTARVSTGMWGHTLAEVIPTLIKDGAPAFGRDTAGPQLTRVPLVPEGDVIIGTPTPVSTAVPASAAASH